MGRFEGAYRSQGLASVGLGGLSRGSLSGGHGGGVFSGGGGRSGGCGCRGWDVARGDGDGGGGGGERPGRLRLGGGDRGCGVMHSRRREWGVWSAKRDGKRGSLFVGTRTPRLWGGLRDQGSGWATDGLFVHGQARWREVGGGRRRERGMDGGWTDGAAQASMYAFVSFWHAGAVLRMAHGAPNGQWAVGRCVLHFGAGSVRLWSSMHGPAIERENEGSAQRNANGPRSTRRGGHTEHTASGCARGASGPIRSGRLAQQQHYDIYGLFCRYVQLRGWCVTRLAVAKARRGSKRRMGPAHAAHVARWRRGSGANEITSPLGPVPDIPQPPCAVLRAPTANACPNPLAHNVSVANAAPIWRIRAKV